MESRHKPLTLTQAAELCAHYKLELEHPVLQHI
jgi:hypothetical protein